MLDRGADKTNSNDYGETPYDWAVRYDAPAETRELLQVPMTLSRNITANEHEFVIALKENDQDKMRRLLSRDRSLAGHNFNPGSQSTEGFPLVHAAATGNLEMVNLLLKYEASPDCFIELDEPRESGMPLMHGWEQRRFDIVHLLLDHNANTDAFPYCSTPFVDCLFNEMWQHPEHDAWKNRLLETSLAYYFDEQDVTSMPDLPASTPENAELIKLLHRVVSLQGRPSIFTVVRHEPYPLLRRLLSECPDQPNTPLDWPQGTIFSQVCYAASWTGYPEILDIARATCPAHYTPDVAKWNIHRAILSHNRDGSIAEYSRLIRSQLDFLCQENAVKSEFANGDPFLPYQHLAANFMEPCNYGFKAQSLSSEADLVHLAELFAEFGFDLNEVDPKSGFSPLDAAQEQGHDQYQRFLKSHGAQNS